MHPFLVALSICVVAVAAEAAAAGKNPKACLRGLQEPGWALPFWSWYVIGFLFYGACLVALYFVLGHDPSSATRWRALQLLLLIMVLNPAWNLMFFRYRALAASFWFYLPFAAIVFWTVYCLHLLDNKAAMLFLQYLLYLPYGCAWSYGVWRLNRGDGIGRNLR